MARCRTTLFAVASNGYAILQLIYNFYPVEFNRAKNGIYVRYGLRLPPPMLLKIRRSAAVAVWRDDGSEVGMYTYDGDMGLQLQVSMIRSPT